MIEYEKGLVWSCEYVVNFIYRSLVVVFNIVSKIVFSFKI